tara:strand:+ start:1103 stop:1690 length:588 start_codon:yes stop_codon:yes gene_type:complete
MKKSQIRKLIREVITEQTQITDYEACMDIVNTMAGTDINVGSFEAAQEACCAKCSTVQPGDACYEFCVADIGEGCCRIDEPCYPPANGCPQGFSWNVSTCHCEHDNLSDNPCQVFSMMNMASQESVCNACDNGTPNAYQSNFCGCCPDGQGGTPSSGGIIHPGKDDGGNKAPLASKSKPIRPFKTPKKKIDWRNS